MGWVISQRLSFLAEAGVTHTFVYYTKLLWLVTVFLTAELLMKYMKDTMAKKIA